MPEHKDAERIRPGTSMHIINSQPVGEVQGQPLEVDSRGFSQPISEIVIPTKLPVSETKPPPPLESGNQSSSDKLWTGPNEAEVHH